MLSISQHGISSSTASASAFSLMMDQYGYAEAEAVLDEISNLMMAGQLFTDDRELQGFTPHTEPIVKAICLHMAHDCNLRCKYCFAATGDFCMGERKLKGTTVHAKDLRAGAALIIAGLAAEGTTVVKNIHYVERGYERIIEKLTGLGAQIRRIED